MGSLEPFADNWAYLKAELIWLDRLLSVTVARQRKETKEVDRFTRTAADRVTSHWWKGLVSLEGIASYDSPAETPAQPAKASFQQQMEAKVQVSQAQGVALGLPTLCDRLHLSRFEKNAVLLALAPEISRRYGRLYSYLQDTDREFGLPSVDLLLRLLCRTDREWQQGRQHLAIAAPLVQQGLVAIVGTPAQPFLSRSVKLCDRLADYLLAEQPSHLEDLLIPAGPEILQVWNPIAAVPDWSNLVLPEPLLTALQHLCNSLQMNPQIDRWGFGSETPGIVALLAGPAGTGKTTAARTIAQSLQTSLVWVDLRSLHPDRFPALLQEIESRSPTLLLLKNAHLWLDRDPQLPPSEIHRLLDQRCHSASLTLFSLERSSLALRQWRQRCDRTLTFPLPNSTSRLRLWQAAFPASMPLDPNLNWHGLAQLALSGQEIQTIARRAAGLLAADPPDSYLKLSHLQSALLQMENVKNRTKNHRGLV